MDSSANGNSVVVSATDVGKCYHIYARPQDRLKQAFFRWRRQYYQEFWALRYATFEVRRGEALGIIGRNGSGKSTLLQILAGTLHPTEGEVRTSGRVAALLELGSGFNPDFTGRENVYMNGTILGLPRRMIDEKFDDIAAFADIGPFINQPVRTYSSGMYVRLAFAVQVLLEPEILIVDEALAVGDEGYQRKCFGALERFRDNGGTLLFVTHASQLIVQICDRAALLDGGRVLALGDSKPVVDVYQKLLYGTAAEARQVRSALTAADGRIEKVKRLSPVKPTEEVLVESEPAPAAQGYFDASVPKPPEVTYGGEQAEIGTPAMCDERGKPINVLTSGQVCKWRYNVRFATACDGVCFGMMLKTVQGVDVFGVNSAQAGRKLAHVPAGAVVEVEFRLHLNVTPGTYFLNSGVSCERDGQDVYLHRRVDVAAIRVVPRDAEEHYGLAFTDPSVHCRVQTEGVLR